MRVTTQNTPTNRRYKAAFRRAKFLCHILHAEQSFLTLSFDIITVNQFSPMEFIKKSQLKLNT